MKVLVTGATGFIGKRLVQKLIEKNFRVVAPVRSIARAKEKLPAQVELVHWKDATAVLPAECCREVEGVVHLLGESIADSRWTEKRKKELTDSRIKSAERLFEIFKTHPPKVFVSASAVGFYGDRGDEKLDERSTAGRDFLSNLTIDWEKAAHRFESLGSRVVCVRTGIVLGKQGGALEKMLPVFRLGLGGKLGSGKQWMSWIHLDDLVGIYIHALQNNSLSGAINAVAPLAVRNEEFTTQLGRALKRPTVLAVPSLALKIAVGELAGALLGGQHVHPRILAQSGFQFLHPKLDSALADIISGHSR